MYRLISVAAVVSALLPVAVIDVQPAEADLIKLKNGGEVRGRIDRKRGSTKAAQVTIVTLNGTVVVVDRSQIEFVTRRSVKIEEYETRAKAIPHSIDAHLELAEWCRKNGLTRQRVEQLKSVIEIAADHEKAQAGLGHTLRNGKWMTRDEDMLSRGYVKYKNRYVTPQEMELIQKTKAELDREQAWYKDVRLWLNWIKGRKAELARQGLAELQQIIDPDAVAALSNFMHDDKSGKLRRLYVEILGRIPGNKPVKALVVQSRHDSNYEIRYESLNSLSSKQYEAAMPIFLRELRNESNVVVRRAGVGLQRVGDERAIPNLIAALITTHRYKVRVPKKGVGFGTNGSFGGTTGNSVLPPNIELMLRSGQLPNGVIINQPSQANVLTKVITIKYDHKNREVLSALSRLTGKDFSYDQRTWRLWVNTNKNALGKVSAAP